MFQDQAFTIVYVDDMEESTRFYRDILGLPIKRKENGWTEFQSRGASLVLHPRTTAAGGAGQGCVHLAFRVDDAGQVYDELTAKGARFAGPPAQASFGRHATLFDPEGNAIDLIEWAPSHGMPVVVDETVVNEIISKTPEAMEVFEEHGIRICGGCIVLLNGSVHETAEYSGLSPREASTLVEELNEKLASTRQVEA